MRQSSCYSLGSYTDFEGKSAEEWMGRLCMVAAECSYREVDHQLKEQFIHGLNDKVMLDKVIRELTAKNSSEQTTSEDVLSLARRIEAQRAQVAILSDITKAQNLTRFKWSKSPKTGKKWKQHAKHITTGHANTVGEVMHPGSVQLMGNHAPVVGKCVISRRYAEAGGHTVHEVEVEVMTELQEEDIETVSINSIHLNSNQSLITAHLKMQVGETTTEVPYKIDTGSEGNIMPLYIFKRLFKNKLEEQLKGSIKSNIKLKTYNRTHITQLSTCAVIIKFKNFKKQCVFFVVPGNGQALLGMPDTAALNIINLNIDSIQR